MKLDSQVNKNIEAIVDIVEKDILDIENHESPEEELNYMEIVFYMVLHLVNLIEEHYNKSRGIQKKLIVIEVGEVITNKFFPQYLSYYNENIDYMIETVISSFKVLSHHKTIVKTCPCFPF